MTISAPAISAPPSAPPSAPVAKESGDSRSQAESSTFQAVFAGASSSSQKPAGEKSAQSKSSGAKKALVTKPIAPGTSAPEKNEDPTRTAPAILSEQPAEIRAFGAPDVPSTPHQGVPFEPPDLQVTSKVIALTGTDPSTAMSGKTSIPMPQPQEQAAAKPQTVLGLELSIPKPANPAQPAPAENPAPVPAALAAAPISLPIAAQAKAAAGEPIPEPKIEPLFNAVANEPMPQSKPQAEAPPPAPARVERPADIAPIEPARPQPTSSREITVRLADLQQRATDVRFVERGGQVHVSVRTNDAEFGRTLRGGLNDLMTRLDHAGIRAELSRAGSDGASFKNQSRSSDEGNGGSRSSRDQRQRRDQSQPQNWMEEFQAVSDGGQSQ